MKWLAKKLDKLWYWWHSNHCHGDKIVDDKYHHDWTVKVCEFLEKWKYKFER